MKTLDKITEYFSKGGPITKAMEQDAKELDEYLQNVYESQWISVEDGAEIDFEDGTKILLWYKKRTMDKDGEWTFGKAGIKDKKPFIIDGNFY